MTCGGVVTFWILLLFSIILLNVNITNGRPDELHIGGIFPINGKGGWQGGQACMPAAQMALDDVNARENLLPGFKLILHSNDSEVSPQIIYANVNKLRLYFYLIKEQTILLVSCNKVNLLVSRKFQIFFF